MADIQSQVRQQLDQFKQQVTEAQNGMHDLDTLMTGLETECQGLVDLITSLGQMIQERFDGVNPDIKTLSDEFDHDYDALLQKCSSIEKEYEDDAATIETEVNNCGHEIDDYIKQIEEHDHTVDSTIQDAKNKAEEVIQKAKQTAEHVVDTATNAAQTVVHGVESAAKSVEHGVEDAWHTVQQGIHSAVQGLLGHGNDIGSLVRAQAEHLGEGLQNQDQQLQQEMVATLQQFESGFTEHVNQLVQEVDQMDHLISTVSQTVTDLTSHGVDTVGVMTDAAMSTNVGLNEVIGAVNDVKEILDEIGL
jgi:cell division septum initiation protein DivIVA